MRIFLNYYKHNGGATWTGKKMHVSPALYWIRWQNWVVELLEAFTDRRMHNIKQLANKEKESSTITRKKLCRTLDFCFNNKLTSFLTPFSAIAVFTLSLKVEGKHLRKQKLTGGFPRRKSAVCNASQERRGSLGPKVYCACTRFRGISHVMYTQKRKSPIDRDCMTLYESFQF